MNLFLKNIINILSNDGSSRVLDSSKSEDITVVEEINKLEINPLKKNEKEDFQLLLSLYKKHKSDENIDVAILVKEINPKATSQRCPYCEVLHEFTASRARKCLKCSKKMIVRQGFFVTEEQAEKLEKKIQDSYEKQSVLLRVGNSLESVQDCKIHKERVEYLHYFAEAFRFMAQVDNQKDTKGYSFWDKAWGYYNEAKLEEMKSLKQDMMEYSKIPDISWDMAQMLLDQAASRKNEKSVIKGKKKTLSHLCITLVEIAKLNANPYFITELYEFAKKIIEELEMTNEEFKNISIDVATSTHISSNTLKKYNKLIKELLEYEVICLR